MGLSRDVKLLGVTLLWLNSLVLSAPLLNHNVTELHVSEDITVRRRQQSPLEATTGIQTFGVHPRLEIRQLEQRTDQWNIYLLGLAKFQAMNQSDKFSYYSIAGLHSCYHRQLTMLT
jgi:tyrosinase